MNPTLKESVLAAYKRADNLNKIADQSNAIEKKIHVKAPAGSMPALLAAMLFEKRCHHVLALFPDKASAAHHYNDVQALLATDQVRFFPASRRRPYEIEQQDKADVRQRTQVLDAIYTSQQARYIVTYPTAVFEKVATRETYKKNILELATAAHMEPDSLNETLLRLGFTRTDFVNQPGECSLRGGIVDLFSFSNDKPYRIEFLSDEIASIRSFDPVSQLSEEKAAQIQIIPNTSVETERGKYSSFFDLLPENAWILASGLAMSSLTIADLCQKAHKAFSQSETQAEQTDPQALFIDRQSFEAALQNRCVLEFDGPFFKRSQPVTWKCIPQPAFNKKFKLLSKNLIENRDAGIQNFLVCSNEKQIQRFADIFKDLNIPAPYQAVAGELHQGFVDYESGIACYTDHQIFDRHHESQLKNRISQSQALTIKALNALKLGDYVTHIDHGIGKFAGLKKIQVNGKTQEAVKLLYQNDDILYLSVHALHKIARYRSKESKAPKLNKLGSPAWKSLKKKTKRKAKELAFDLIQLYAKRKMQKGFGYAPDTYLQHELEASFLYEDTPDQNKATREVKADMESQQPMDRLICGDVGFGKTEIAIRAAFKAVTDGKQVAVLVPTTILAFQHFRNFSQRLAAFSVKVDYLNRFRTAKDKKKILEKTAKGEIDILIGTHQLISKNVKFKDFCLLIVDEEHKFGVNVKDKLKTLRANIDTLTLTATPIPRTLQFSLMAARDLSVIKTPPTNRQAIQTERIGFQEDLLRQAIRYELDRGGQVFFIHDHIEHIAEVANILQRLIPDAKIHIGHGQMEGKKLETTLLNFMRGDFDILVSTTIVESGLDIPNANTIFINRANHFGLADLHQLRGRVGRSNKKAFCYLITPPYAQISPEARKRLQAVEQFSDLGAGFNIAMKDLEIRGAGDILGAEQSGFIADMGFETYQKILDEAVREVKENDFKDLYQTEKNELEKGSDLQLDTDFEILLPDTYVNSVAERLDLYARLSHIDTRAALRDFQSELTDRFGALPDQARDLMDSVSLKIEAKKLGFQRVVLKNGLLLGYFIQREKFFQSETFSKILQYLQQHPKRFKLKEKAAKTQDAPPCILLKMEQVTHLQQVLAQLHELKLWVFQPDGHEA